jgi:hypothetical protein
MPKPRKSFKTVKLKLTVEHYRKLPSLTANQGGWQTPYQYLAQYVRPDGDGYVTRARESDIEKLKEYAQRPDDGTYEKTAFEILQLNGIDANV